MAYHAVCMLFCGRKTKLRYTSVWVQSDQSDVPSHAREILQHRCSKYGLPVCVDLARDVDEAQGYTEHGKLAQEIPKYSSAWRGESIGNVVCYTR